LAGDFVWDNALPADFLVASPVGLLRRVFDAFEAAFELVTFVLGM
jgi:hypothetical protein